MERYQVILAYDGSHYKGFQRQARDRSVQGTVEYALRKLGWQGTSILAAGRTDTGVHATGQVIAIDLEWNHGSHDLQQAMNNHLPADIVVREVKQVNASFHPRYDASWRKYHYRLYCQSIRQPILEPYAWRVWPAVELESLQQAAALLIGTHDFTAFGTPPQSGGSTVRRVLEASWQEDAPYFIFEIKAHAFLYHMVRRLVFMQVKIAQGKLNLADLNQALHPNMEPGEAGEKIEQQAEKRMVHGLAPAQGLILAEVHYPAQAVRLVEDIKEVEKSVDSMVNP